MYTKQTHLFFFSRILFVRNHFAKKHKALKKIARGLMVTKTSSFDTDNSTRQKNQNQQKGFVEIMNF